MVYSYLGNIQKLSVEVHLEVSPEQPAPSNYSLGYVTTLPVFFKVSQEEVSYCYLYATQNLAHILIFPGCCVPLAQRDKVVRTNPRVVKVSTIYVVI
ncbi:uncharacterized protein Smp_204070 [Schistosoma mansoni]|uniref:uncharacterized protein n=1 Tax=Schistosoma mansoni TaxID=6183 RepID=UPI00022DCA3B|nr:uncharacterized protein Smp_204070 [Schistosoma mansoni]|eukprot:XP_018654076.1 uncharacterized protein Smp_204070 [Schistosoma mansoni]